MKSKVPIVIHNDTLYVDYRATDIHFLVLLSDGMSVTQFKGEKQTYLKVDDAIAWHEKELSETSGASGNQKVLDALKRIRDVTFRECGRVQR